MIAVAFLKYVQTILTKQEMKYFYLFGVLGASAVVFVTVVLLTYMGVIAPWSGRSVFGKCFREPREI